MEKIKLKIEKLSKILRLKNLTEESESLITLIKKSSTYPVPKDVQNDIGLMTLDDFLRYRNPEEKYHQSHSYDFDIEKLNNYYPEVPGFLFIGKDRVKIKKFSDGILLTKNKDGVEEVIAVIHNSRLYYKDSGLERSLDSLRKSEKKDDAALKFNEIKLVKYLSEYVGLVNPVAKNNLSKFPFLIQNIIVNEEPLTIRAEAEPKKDGGQTIVILNDEGLVVAQASNEWGATLIVVAKEYRGHGLGKILGKVWYEKNPGFKSGGFTRSGERNAISIWKERVKEFLSSGWYSELVKSDVLSREKLNQILSDLKEIDSQSNGEQKREDDTALNKSGEILIYCDGTTFIIYDESFLRNPDEKYIHAYGFLRDHGDKIFYFSFDYEFSYQDIATKAALQMVKDNGEKLYNGPGYHDYISLDGFEDYIIQDGDYIIVTKDLIDLKGASGKEKVKRKDNDPFGEKGSLLFELSESKDWPS